MLDFCKQDLTQRVLNILVNVHDVKKYGNLRGLRFVL